MGSWTERVANLRASRRSAPLSQVARQRLAAPKGSLAFLHLMHTRHEVKMGGYSATASYELTDISDIVGTIRYVWINLAADLSVGSRSSA